MKFVRMARSPAVRPRVGLVTADYLFLFDGNPSGDVHGRASDRTFSTPLRTKFEAVSRTHFFVCRKLIYTYCTRLLVCTGILACPLSAFIITRSGCPNSRR